MGGAEVLALLRRRFSIREERECENEQWTEIPW